MTALRRIATRLAQLHRHLDAHTDALMERPLSLLTMLACIVLAVGLAVGALGGLPQRFYDIAAQVLPIFMLVAIVEGRYFAAPGSRTPGDRVFMRGTLAILLAGEAATLVAVAGAGDHVVLRGLVVNSLGWSALLLWLYASRGPAQISATRIVDLAEHVRVLSEHEAAPPLSRANPWQRARARVVTLLRRRRGRRS